MHGWTTPNVEVFSSKSMVKTEERAQFKKKVGNGGGGASVNVG